MKLASMKNIRLAILALGLGSGFRAYCADLFQMVQNNRRDALASALIEGADINMVQDETNNSLLHIAAINSRLGAGSILVQAGIDPRLENAQGQRADQIIGWRGKTGKLISSYFYEYHIRNSGREAFTEFLQTADVNHPLYSDGSTPLHLAAKYTRYTNAQLLLENGASPALKNNDGQRPYELVARGKTRRLLEAAYHNFSEPVFRLIREGNDQEIARMLQAGLDPDYRGSSNPLNQRENRDITPLIYAAQKGKGKIMKLLLEAGADLNATYVSPEINRAIADFGPVSAIQVASYYYKKMDELVPAPVDEIPEVAGFQLAHADANLAAFKNRDFVKTSTFDYTLNSQRSRYFDRPSCPVFHSYHGGAIYPFYAEIPGGFYGNLPEDIRLELARHDINNVTLYFSIQQSSNYDDMLLRPHYWVHEMPGNEFQGDSFKRELLMGLYDWTENIQSRNKKAVTVGGIKSLRVRSHDGRISPNNAQSKGKNFAVAGYSVVIDPFEKKAAVTLHWMLPWENVQTVRDHLLNRHGRSKIGTINSLINTLGRDHAFDAVMPSVENLFRVND